VEKGAKGVDWQGDVNHPEVVKKQEEKKDVGW